MRMLLGDVRRLIEEALVMEAGLSGKMRKPGRSGGQQYKIGFTPDENRELGLTQVYSMFPGAAELWGELACEMFPEHPFADDPQSMIMSSLWFEIGGKLRVSLKEMPGVEVAEWDPAAADGEGDWRELDMGGMSAVA